MQPVFCDKFQYFRPIPYFNVHKLKMDFDIADTSRSSGEYLESGSTSTSWIGAACILWPYFEYRYGSGRFFVTAPSNGRGEAGEAGRVYTRG